MPSYPPVVVECNCAGIPPTMPTCRDYHLWSCPVGKAQSAARRASREPLRVEGEIAQRLIDVLDGRKKWRDGAEQVAHDHTTFVPGCFRCELGRDETGREPR